MKRLVIICGVLVCVCLSLLAVLLVRNPSSAKSLTGERWTYAAITGSYVPYSVDNPTANASGAVNICYVTTGSCRNEEVRADVNYSNFFQDMRLENSAKSRQLAQKKAIETAYVRAMAKLGNEGYEMITSPPLQFDLYIPVSASGDFKIQEGNNERRWDIYFKKPY